MPDAACATPGAPSPWQLAMAHMDLDGDQRLSWEEFQMAYQGARRAWVGATGRWRVFRAVPGRDADDRSRMGGVAGNGWGRDPAYHALPSDVAVDDAPEAPVVEDGPWIREEALPKIEERRVGDGKIQGAGPSGALRDPAPALPVPSYPQGSFGHLLAAKSGSLVGAGSWWQLVALVACYAC
eukprot:Skav223933  [mRNA]  locus=scaffold2593:506257:510635:+ [translate_table: standard]